MNVLARLPQTMQDLLVMPRPEWLGSPWTKAAGALLLLLALSGLLRMGLAGLRQLGKRFEPVTLFARIGGQLGLGWRDRWLLWRIARRTGLASPLTLLLSGSTLDHHAASCAERMSTGRAQRLTHRAKAIRQSLFGGH